MKFNTAHCSAIILFLSLVCVESLFLPGKDAFISSSTDNRNEDGSYNFGFKTSQGIEREEMGFFNELGKWVVKGVVSWIAPDNKIYGYKYEADENGYQQFDMPPEDGDNRIDAKSKKGLLGGAL
ncbi:endocuticle structural protein SgAbd-6 [Nilaparvata lugens]|uniref:Cuticular protein n=1 Tax=Nilaparvata lugens TaxID=108931 RepID=A0A2S1ZS76_NILLU|nr:endocuticle structural protein SgAbd-6 [Nilaparvata lugens]AWK28319.1 cuticular protein [Nilaparvata lugens]